MNAKVVVCLLSFVVVLGVQDRGLLADPPKKDAPASKPAKGARPLITMQERIAMGVDEPTWIKEHGKVHPEVRSALKEQKELEKKVDKDPLAEFQPGQSGRPVGFVGLVYVVVHLDQKQQGKADSAENKAAIKQVQSSVLSKLAALECSLWLRFEDRPAMLVWVNEAGLAKLEGDAKVVAIGPDAKPRPRADRPKFFSDKVEQVDGRFPKVDPHVREALEQIEEVLVGVFPELDRQLRDPLEKYKHARVVQDRILSQLSADEFRPTARIWAGHVTGLITKAGLAKAAELPEVATVAFEPHPPKLSGWKGEKP